MAKKTTTVTPVEPKHLIDKAGAKEAMQIVGKPLKAVNAAFDELASMPTAGKAQRSLCATFFAHGKALIKDASADTSTPEAQKARFNERFDAFAKAHWTDVSAATLKGYRSQYGAFHEAAFAKHDMSPSVTACLEIANVQMPWRASAVRKLMALDKKPSGEVIADMLKPGEADQTKKGGEARFKALVNLAVNTGADTKFGTWLNSQPEIAAWLKPVLRQFVKHQSAVAANAADGSAKTAMLKAIGGANATIAAAVVAVKANRRAPRGATIN